MYSLRIPYLGQLNQLDIRYWVLLPIMGIFLLLSILSWMHAGRVREVLPQHHTPQKSPVPLITLQSPVFKVPLFGAFVPLDTAIEPATFDAEIVGVLYDKVSALSQVIIRVGDEGEKNYQVGDTLSGGAIIEKIDETGAVVRYNGKLERLNLPQNPLNLSPVEEPSLDEE